MTNLLPCLEKAGADYLAAFRDCEKCKKENVRQTRLAINYCENHQFTGACLDALFITSQKVREELKKIDKEISVQISYREEEINGHTVWSLLCIQDLLRVLLGEKE